MSKQPNSWSNNQGKGQKSDGFKGPSKPSQPSAPSHGQTRGVKPAKPAPKPSGPLSNPQDMAS